MNFQMRITLIILLTISSKFVLAQQTKMEKNQNINDIISVEKTKNYPFFGTYHHSIMYSYQHSTFYSAKFNENLENGIVEHGYGDSFTFRQGIHPFMMDISGFISRYNSPLSVNRIRFRGFEMDIVIKIPYIPKYLLKPYIGIGYQYSQIDNNESFINTSQTVWKVGIIPLTVYLVPEQMYLSINIEYKQSLDLYLPYSFNQLSVGIVFGFKD